MRAFVSAVYLFLYAPIALVVLFSFNAGRNASEFTGFSTQWYGKALSNTFLVAGTAEQPDHRLCQRRPGRRLRHHGRARHGAHAARASARSSKVCSPPPSWCPAW